MRNTSCIRALLFAAILILPMALLARPASKQEHSVKNVVCSDCHACTNPTASNPCFKRCPRPHATPKDIKQGPAEVILGLIQWDYEPVVFDHKVHAEMSAMGHECTTCHHYAEGGAITACKECHPVTADEHSRQPGLKGAYHRQCMSCHEEWSGVNDCEICHAKKPNPGPAALVGQNPTRRPMRTNPAMAQPTKKVWYSTYGGGTVVTLFHRNHSELYGIDCASCHHAEGCTSCHHSENVTTQTVRHSEEALHAICNQCHAEMSCDQCHLKQEAAEFSHDRTGWPLGRHQKLACRKCHGDPNHFTKPSPACNSCHSGWTALNFDHARTGFALDEAHREIDCDVCHSQRAFSAGPTCSECHDSDYSWPAKKPGVFTRN